MVVKKCIVKKLTSKGWSMMAPKNKNERMTMKKQCGPKCFLGAQSTSKTGTSKTGTSKTGTSKTSTSFPICAKGTCKINTKGIYAAYVRGRQYSNKNDKYKSIASRAKKMLKKRGFGKNLK